MRILIVGAGATGVFFGARLIQAGRDVTFLVREGRAAQLRHDGLRVLSPQGDFQVQPAILTAAELNGPFELILLTVKAYALEQALADIAPAVGLDTMILPLLNGLRHLDAIAARFGQGALIGGVCKVISSLDEQGRIVQVGTINEVFYGELDGARSERLGGVHAALSGAGFATRWSDDIRRDLWEKWVMLASLGGINSLMRGTVGQVAAAPGGVAFIHALIDELVGIATAVGSTPGTALIAQVRHDLTRAGSAQTSSMYRDLLAGGAIEAEQIIGDLLRRGEEGGLRMPLLAAVHVNLCVYQSSRDLAGRP
jgi:2-dehydropantoate 2-reductase